jgi:hypothetical protein
MSAINSNIPVGHTPSLNQANRTQDNSSEISVPVGVPSCGAAFKEIPRRLVNFITGMCRRRANAPQQQTTTGNANGNQSAPQGIPLQIVHAPSGTSGAGNTASTLTTSVPEQHPLDQQDQDVSTSSTFVNNVGAHSTALSLKTKNVSTIDVLSRRNTTDTTRQQTKNDSSSRPESDNLRYEQHASSSRIKEEPSHIKPSKFSDLQITVKTTITDLAVTMDRMTENLMQNLEDHSTQLEETSAHMAATFANTNQAIDATFEHGRQEMSATFEPSRANNQAMVDEIKIKDEEVEKDHQEHADFMKRLDDL